MSFKNFIWCRLSHFFFKRNRFSHLKTSFGVLVILFICTFIFTIGSFCWVNVSLLSWCSILYKSAFCCQLLFVICGTTSYIYVLWFVALWSCHRIASGCISPHLLKLLCLSYALERRFDVVVFLYRLHVLSHDVLLLWVWLLELLTN